MLQTCFVSLMSPCVLGISLVTCHLMREWVFIHILHMTWNYALNVMRNFKYVFLMLVTGFEEVFFLVGWLFFLVSNIHKCTTWHEVNFWITLHCILHYDQCIVHNKSLWEASILMPLQFIYKYIWVHLECNKINNKLCPLSARLDWKCILIFWL